MISITLPLTYCCQEAQLQYGGPVVVHDRACIETFAQIQRTHSFCNRRVLLYSQSNRKVLRRQRVPDTTQYPYHAISFKGTNLLYVFYHLHIEDAHQSTLTVPPINAVQPHLFYEVLALFQILAANMDWTYLPTARCTYHHQRPEYCQLAPDYSTTGFASRSMACVRPKC
jgi:hypothetical protein